MIVHTHHRTRNDINGNPRRLIVVQIIEEGGHVDTVAVYTASYGDPSPALKAKIGPQVCDVDITVPEYRRLLKRAKAHDLLQPLD